MVEKIQKTLSKRLTIGVKFTKIIRLMQLSGELALVPDDIGYLSKKYGGLYTYEDLYG